jgi:alkanesulfonate monooxygenase SsuD/methylene tetrahydromethanopterin reductase-like flavin-dependent oxidoreductase (luciferase family)
VLLLRRLWREPVVDFRGRFHRIDRAGILPLPRREIPIWFGGFTPVAVRRAARVGDGLLFGTSPSRMRGLQALAREELAKAGRDAQPFGFEAVVDASDDPEVWLRELTLWRELGGTHLSLRAMDTGAEFVGSRRVGYRGLADYVHALERFKSAVG